MIQLTACLARHFPSFGEQRPDGELLAAFLSNRDETAFAELVRRHGALVWSACRRLLPDATDAEDAFQSTFLVLVRRANRLTGRDAIGPWLYQVAVWTARNIRRRNARILSRRQPLADSAGPAPPSADVHMDLDAALAALPEKYRTPLVLCHLQGWSRREAAARLGCPEGTLSSLLARGLDRLRAKLQVTDPVKALAVASPAVPLLLANTTVKAAAGMHLAGAVSASVSPLVEGVLRMFWVKKATAASVALFAVFGFGMGIGVSVKHMPGAAAGEETVLASVDGAELKQLEASLTAEDAILVEALARVKAAEDAADAAKAGGQKQEIEKARLLLLQALQKKEESQKQRDLVVERLRLLKTRTQPKPPAEADEIAKLKEQIAALQKLLKDLEDAIRRHQSRIDSGEATQDSALKLQAQIELTRATEQKAEALQKLARLQAKSEELQVFRFYLQQFGTEREAFDAQLARNQTDLKKLDEQIAKLKAEQDALQAESLMLALRREAFQKQLAELEAKRAEAKRAGVKDLLFAPDVSSIDLTITKDAAWPFKIAEVGPDGKAIGAVGFTTIEVLTCYLARAAKDAKPKSVRLTVQADTKLDVVKKVIEACTAAGLKPPTVLNIDKLKGELPLPPRFTDLAERIAK